MSITTDAIYERGILKLSQPIPLADGTRVEVIVIPCQSPETPTPSELLATIAALPLEGKQPTLTPQSQPSEWIDRPFFGLWRDREDLQDSTAWVRQLRRTEWDATND